MTSGQNSPVELCKNLRIAQKFLGPTSGNYALGSQKSKDRGTQLCDCLSWMALCFVRDVSERDVAICLNAGKILELLVSDNQGSQEKADDKEVITLLRRITVRGLRARIASKDAYDPIKDGAYAETVKCMLQLTWPKIGVIIEEVRSGLKDKRITKPPSFFIAHLDKWIESRKAANLPTEMFTELKKQYLTPDRTNDSVKNVELLKRALLGLFSGPTKSPDVGGIDPYITYMQNCAYVEHSDFLSTSLSSISLKKEELLAFVKLRHKLRKLTRYTDGAFLYLTEGIKFLNRIFTDERTVTEQLLRFTFIGRNPSFNMMPQTFQWPKPPVVSGVEGSVWQGNTPFIARVHCEVAMICYVEGQNINLAKKAWVIGTSTLLCHSCGIFVDAVGNKIGHDWKLPESSNTREHNWLTIESEFNEASLLRSCFLTVSEKARDIAQMIMEGKK